MMEKLDSRGRERTFIYGHSNRGRKFPNLKHDKQFKKGHKSWNTGLHIDTAGVFVEGHKINLGRKHPKEFGEKVSNRNRGREITYKGDKHWNWKGGITTEDKKLRMKFRLNLMPIILERDSYTCQICEQYGGELQVDHIKSWAEYPELRFEESNCRTLCMACHYYITFKRKIPKGVVWGHNLSRRIES